MLDYQEMYEKLLAEFEQYKLESVKWGTLDFTSSEVDGMQISEDKAQDALEDMIRHHDCNNGITWVTVDHYLRMYGGKVPEGEEQWRKDLIKEQKSYS